MIRHAGFAHAVMACLFISMSISPLSAAEFQTWVDRSGQFTITAKFVELKDDADKTVVLEDEDGEQIEIPLAELNAAGRVEVEKARMAAKSPFKRKGSKPSSPFRKSKGPASSDEPMEDTPEIATDGPAKTFQITSAAPTTLKQGSGQLFGGSSSWNVEPDASEFEHKLPNNGVRIKLPSIHYRFKGMAVARDATAAVAFWENPFGKVENGDSVGLCVIDLAKGKAGKVLGAGGKSFPVAVASGGKAVLVRTIPGRDQPHELIFAALKSSSISPVWTCVPFGDTDDGPKQSISWASLLPNGTVAVAHHRGQFRVFDPETEQALFDAEIDDRFVPAVSANGKQLALVKDGFLSVYDTDSFDLLGSITVPSSVSAQRVAFHSDGTEIAVVGSRGLATIDATTGQMDVEGITVNAVRILSPFDKPGNFTHAGGSLYFVGEHLVDTKTRMHVWTYNGLRDSFSMGTNTFLLFGLGGVSATDLAIVGDLPHPPARAVWERFNARDDLYALQPGDSYRVDASAIPAGERETVLKAFREASARVDENSDVVLKLGTKSGKTQTQEYRSIGFGSGGNKTASFTPTLGTAKLMRGNETLWEGETYLSASMLPFMIHQSVDKVVEQSRKVHYANFASVKPPAYVFDPKVVKIPLGTSTVSSRGFTDSVNAPGEQTASN